LLAGALRCAISVTARVAVAARAIAAYLNPVSMGRF
jgi:hypothetical protein